MAKRHLQFTSGPSSICRITGSQPGALDVAQPSRLLRLHSAKLSFAAFDPLTACVQDTPDPTKSRLNTELYRPKRVVIETAPSGECTWRFVPSAKRENGVPDEGVWPRVVDICGEFVEMSQDQWDIYKLDPLYECFVPAHPQVTTIRNVSQPRPLSPQPVGKHQLSSRSPSPYRTMPPPSIPPPRRAFVQSESESDDEDEVEAMVIADEQSLPHRRSITRARERVKSRDRQARREKIQRKMELFSQDDDMYRNIFPNGSTFDQRLQPPTSGRTTPEPNKRKLSSALDTSWSPDAREVEELRLRLASNYIFASNAKRMRTNSSQEPRRGREFKQKRMERSNTKRQRRMEETEARRCEREKRLLDEIMEEVPQTIPSTSTNATLDIPATPDASMASDDLSPQVEETPGTQDQELPNSEDAAHREVIEESRRKLAELERDRPLWEEEARRRRLREEVEQQIYKAKIKERRQEEERKKVEVDSRIRKECEEEMKNREKEKNAQREREFRDQERKQRRQRWSFGPWTTQRALERYRILSESFDATRFTSELPLNVEDVPWPSLQSPRSFLVEDVTWNSVERFFEAIRPHLKHQDYKTLVEQSHRRFHPDRWRSRNLLKTVEDEVVRGCMEVAANTVAQALTPIWRNLKNR